MYKPFYCRTTPVDRLNWAKTTFWWWWDESDNTTLHIRHGIQKYTVACVCASTLLFGGRTASHNIQSLRVSGKETLCFFETFEPSTLSKQITELWHRRRWPGFLCRSFYSKRSHRVKLWRLKSLVKIIWETGWSNNHKVTSIIILKSDTHDINKRRWHTAGLMVGQRHRRWSNIKPAVG